MTWAEVVHQLALVPEAHGFVEQGRRPRRSRPITSWEGLQQQRRARRGGAWLTPS
ncbi:MAG TPA: hypothetical protein VKN16_21355 [Methylomirabilota bacterium]|jgi:hypothetical protein|nr:hypothetical protein [Methylomirabilota bacterium]